MTLTKIITAALAITLALAASAHASTFHYAGERDAASNPQVAAIAAWGSSWLAAHGWRPCATQSGGTLRMAPDLGDDPVRGPFYGMALECDIWIRTSVVAVANARGVLALWVLCVTEVHELAHTAGMTHELMASTGLEGRWRHGCAHESDRLHRHLPRAAASLAARLVGST